MFRGCMLVWQDTMSCLQPDGTQEVETLFHEFGHALQHMLTTVEIGLVSGIRGVEWDAVRARARCAPAVPLGCCGPEHMRIRKLGAWVTAMLAPEMAS